MKVRFTAKNMKRYGTRTEIGINECIKTSIEACTDFEKKLWEMLEMDGSDCWTLGDTTADIVR